MIDSSPATTKEWFARGPLIDRRSPGDRARGEDVRRRRARIARRRAARAVRRRAGQPRSARHAARARWRPSRARPSAPAFSRRPTRSATPPTGACSTSTRRSRSEVPGARALRPRIEHAQILDALDIPRFASLGVIASMQPTHCTSDMPWAPARLGAARVAEGAYVWQKLLQAGREARRRLGLPRRTSRSAARLLCRRHAADRAGRAAGRLGARRATEPRRGAARVHAGRRVRGPRRAGSRLDRSRQARRFRRPLPRYHEGASRGHPAHDGGANHRRRPHGVFGACSVIVEMTTASRPRTALPASRSAPRCRAD